MAITTNGLQLVRLAGAVFNQQLSASDYSEILASNKTAAELDAWANAAVAAEFRNKTTTDIAKAVLANVGLSSITGLEAWVAGQLTAGGGVAKAGQTMLSLLNDYSNMSTTEAIYGASVVTFNTKVANSQTLSQTAGTATGTYASVGTTAPAVVFPLTTGADVKTFGSGNDTINALYASATGMTFQATDSLDGGTGSDTINIQVGATGTHAAASMVGIETVSANFSATGGTVSLLGSTGVTTVESSASTTAGAFSNIGSVATALKVSNTASDATFGFTTAAVAGTADTVALTLSGVTGGTVVIAGVETIGITSSGSANTLTGLTAASATTVNVAGDQALTLGTLGSTVTTLNAGTNTASGLGVTATMGPAATATITGGTGNDLINVSAILGNVSIAGGAGNDTVTATTNVTTTDTISGGDGVADVLSTTAAVAEGYTAPTTRTITGFERLTLSTAGSASATLTTANVDTGIATVTLSAGTGGAYGITGPAGTLAVSSATPLLGALTLTDTGSAITDAATLTNSGTTASVNVLGGVAVTSTGYETLNISTGSTSSSGVTSGAQTLGAVTVTVDTGGASAVNFTGVNSLTTGAVSATTISASGMTGTAALTLASATGATSITGTANADNIGASSVAASITGGDGADTISGGTLNDTINGGDGADSITGGRGKDSITGGAGIDTFVIAQPTVAAITSTVGLPDVITDFTSGTDKLSLGQTVTAFLGNYTNFTLAQTAANADGRGNLAYFVSGENNLYVQASTTGGINVNTDTVVTLSNVTSLVSADLLLGAQGTGNTVVLVAAAVPVVSTTASNATNSVLTTTQDDTITAVTGSTAAATSLTGTGAAIDGGLGSDTLNITAAADAQVTSLVTAGTTGVAVTNVETVNLTVTATAAANALGTLPATLTTLTATGTDSNGAITATVGATGQTITVTNTLGTTGSTITFGAFPGVTAGVATQTVTTGAAADTFNTIAVDGIKVDGGAGDDTFNITNAAAFDDDALMITITGGTGTDAITFPAALITTTATVNLADTTDVSISGVETLNAGAVSVDARAVVLSVTMPAGTAFRTISGTTAAAGGLNIGSDDITFTATAAQIDALTTITSGAANGVFSVASSDTAGPITVNLADTTYTIANIDSITFASVLTGVVTVTIDENVAVIGGSGADVLNVTADLGNVTLAASAFETVNFNAVQATTVTIANSATTVNATAGGVFILGTGGDTFNNSGAVAATVTGGSGTDVINHSGTAALQVLDAEGAETINVTGTGALTHFGTQVTNGGITTINLPANSTVDNIYFTSAATTGTAISTSVNRTVVTGFNSSADLIYLDGDITTVATVAGAPVIQVVASAPTATVTFATTNDILLFNFDIGGTADQLGADLTGNSLLAALGQTLAITADTNQGYIMAFDNGFLYIYQAIESNDAGNANFAAADIVLIGKINAEVGTIGVTDIVLAGM